jgi:hypothetical protein
LDRANAARVDPALSGLAYDANAGVVTVVVQNRGARTLAGLRVEFELGGVITAQALADLAVGGSVAVTFPVDRVRLAAEGRLALQARLVLPAGMVDRSPGNNRRTAVISAAALTGGQQPER